MQNKYILYSLVLLRTSANWILETKTEKNSNYYFTPILRLLRHVHSVSIQPVDAPITLPLSAAAISALSAYSTPDGYLTILEQYNSIGYKVHPNLVHIVAHEHSEDQTVLCHSCSVCGWCPTCIN